jgi:anti-sigma regulatory factor (Ser/Thr protein kinase)
MAENNREKVITITLPTDTYFMSGIRDFTLTMVRNLTGMNDQWAYRFQSVVDELCNNAIEHGSAPGQVVTITFKSVAGQYIEIIVEDTGTGKQQIDAKELEKRVHESANSNTHPLQNLGLRGRGLSQIVTNWTSDLKFDNSQKGGIRVTARKDLSEEDQKGEQAQALGFVSAK